MKFSSWKESPGAISTITSAGDDLDLCTKNQVVDSPALLIYLLNSIFILLIPFTLFVANCLERRAENLSGLLTIYVIQLTGGCATWSALICRSFGLSTLWTLNLYCIARGLRHISVIDMAILLCILPPYEYLFSWILVPKKFVAFRIIALILSSCGVLFLTYLDPYNIGSKIIAICGVALLALFMTIRRNLVDDIPISRVTAFYGFLGSIIFHEVSLLVNGTVFCRLQVLTVFPVALCRELFWRHELVYFDNVRIASSVLAIGGGLITALPTRLYEMIEDWIQRRQSSQRVSQSASTAPNPAAASAGGDALNTNSRFLKPTGPLAGDLITSPISETTNRRPTLALPTTRRSFFRGSSFSAKHVK
ncbi:unnamed protein product [Taenia asiatica]|uniref:Solute carrier family 35 member F3 n=1 Tax=Taenia asiatica TaxID=60517 RepID=A0A0R3VUC5_TAEAS|nr:unnamed protein product [Taenia asiatica]